MRLSLILICLALLSCSHNGYLKCEPCARTDLRGKVKNLVLFSKRMDGDLWKVKKDVYEYSEQGYLLVHLDTLARDVKEPMNTNVVWSFASRTIYTYEDDKLLNAVTETFSKDGNYIRTHDYKYDKKGRIVFESEYCSGCLMGPDEEITETEYNDANGTFSTFKKVKRDNEVTIWNIISGRLDDRGNIKYQKEVTPAFYAGDGSMVTPELAYETFFTYDTHGNMVKREYRGGDTLISAHSFEFEDNKIIKYTYDKRHETIKSWTYKYSDLDKHGNYLTSIETNVEGIYEPTITTRQIEYYP